MEDITRIEKFLGSIRNIVQEISEGHTRPKPISREEHYLDDIATALEAGGGGGGTSDYTDLSNKPSINGVTLSGDKTLADLGNKFIITLTENGGTYTADKTEAEMLTAYQAGKELWISSGNISAPCSGLQYYNDTVIAVKFGGLTGSLDADYEGQVAIYLTSNSPVFSSEWIVKQKAIPALPSDNMSNDSPRADFELTKDPVNASLFTKAYNTTGSNTDGTMTQKAITQAVNGVEVLDPTQYPNLASQFTSMISEARVKANQNLGKVVSVVLTANDETLIPYWNEMEALVSAANSVDNPILAGFKVAYKSSGAVNTVWYCPGDDDISFCISCYSITDGHGGFQFSVKAVASDSTQYTPS